MRGQDHDRTALISICVLCFAGCVDGVYRDPVGHADGTAGRGGSPSALSGYWNECGRLGAGGPWKVAISGDGRMVAVLFPEGQVAIHRLADGMRVAVIQASVGPPPAEEAADTLLPWPTRDLVMSPDGSVVAIADGRHVAAWRVADGVPLFDVPGLYSQVRLSPRGDRFIAWRTSSASLFLFELRAAPDGGLLHEFESSAVAFSGDGSEVLSWHDGMLTVWPNDGAGTAVRELPIAPSMTEAILSPDGSTLAGWVGANVQVHRTADGVLLWDEPVLYGAIEFSSDGSKLLVFQSDGLLMADVLTGARGHRSLDPVRDAALGPGGAPLVVADISGLYRAPAFAGALSPLATLPGQGFPIMSLAASADGKWLAVGPGLRQHPAASISPIRAYSEDVLLWNLQQRAVVRTFSGVAASSLQFSSDGRRLLVGDRHPEPLGRLQEWDLDGAAPIWSLTPGGTLAGAGYSPDGELVAVSFSDGVGLVARGGADVGPTIAREIAYPAGAFSPDGKWLATSGVALWKIPELTKVWIGPALPLPPIEPAYRDDWVAFSPDGKNLLSAEAEVFDDGGGYLNVSAATKLYRTSDGTMIYDLGQVARRPVFSPDNDWILAGGLVWQIATGRSVSLHPDPRSTSVSTFLGDGRVALARDDGVVEMFCPE